MNLLSSSPREAEDILVILTVHLLGMANCDELPQFIPTEGWRHLDHPYGPPVRITNLGGLCNYPVIRSDSTESVTAQLTINYELILFILINYDLSRGSIIYYLLSIIYYLLSIIYYLLSIIYYLLSIIYYLLSVICYLLSIIYYLLSIICYLLSVIYYLLSIIYYLLSIIYKDVTFP